MEDCAIYRHPGTWGAPDQDMAYLGLYDGHGGRDMVDYLEHGLNYHVAQELHCEDDASVEQRLERAFLMADIHSKQLGVSTSGATVAICLIKKSRNSNQITLHCANAGDARIVLGHKRKATRLTKDHRPDDPEEVQRIENAGGFIFKGRVVGVLAITRSLGDHCMKSFVIAEPYCSTNTIELEESHQNDKRDDHDDSSTPSMVICACDGLWDVIKDQEAVDFCIKYQHERHNIAEHLVNEAMRKGSTDNISVLVAWL